jgi:hypothetical protein
MNNPNENQTEEVPPSSGARGYVLLAFEFLWLILAMPVMLIGCVCGWMFGAFMSGVKQGHEDWVKWKL